MRSGGKSRENRRAETAPRSRDAFKALVTLTWHKRAATPQPDRAVSPAGPSMAARKVIE